MILTIDAGNTNIVFGGFCNAKLVFTSRIATNKTLTEDEYAAKIREILSLKHIDTCDIEGSIISSVVPSLTASIKNAVQLLCGITPLIVGPGIKTGINLLVDSPAQVGADLICASVAAYNIYGGNCLVMDMGTATKIMFVDEKGAFRGVSIIPGVEVAMNALANQAALLPHIGIEVPKHIIAKNTVDCMHSGIIYGNACMIDGMVERIHEEFNCDMTLVSTGGLANLIVPHCKNNIIQDSELLLKGLYILYEKNQ